MLQQNVLLADGLEQIVGTRQQLGNSRAKGRELQLGMIFQSGNGE